MNEHTPGPWACNKSRHPHDGEFDYAIGAGGKVIAEAFGRVAEGPDGLRPAYANACLISAAPDLLAALKAIAPEGWLDDDTMDHMPGVKEARAAIAKAEGRAP